MGQTLSNYWKDAFLGLFNIVEKPAVLLEEENIIAMNDAFKYSFKIHKTEGLKLTDLVNPDNKIKVKLNLRTFAKGKHMQASTTTTLKMKNEKIRNAKISFSKLDKMIPGQYIMMINFAEEEAEATPVSSTSYLPTSLKNSSQIPRFCFTKREKEIIELLCKGYKTKEISKALFISPKTIEKHRANIVKRTTI
jgi:DNA-binding CsgD family transcriptional regulator